MEQFEFFDLPSPCINVCEVNNRGYCKGCFRSRQERQLWFQLNNLQKRQVLKLCRARYARVMRAKTNQHKTAELPKQIDFDF